jgi:tetratricopeptide (TPR) repeat protein
MDPRFALALANIAYRQVFQGYYGDSHYLDLGIESARQALSIDPNLADAHFSLGSAFALKGENTKARLSFLKALELKPNFVEAMNNYSLAEIDAGRLDEALYWAARSFHLAPNSGNSYYHLSVALIFLGDDATAKRWLTEGEQHHPSDTRVQIMRAILDFIHLGERDEGLRRVRKAINANPDDEELQSLLGDLTFIAGTSDAEEQLQHLASTAPENYGDVLSETNRLKYGYELLRGGHTQASMLMVEQSETRARSLLQRGNETYYPRIELAAVYSLRGNRQQALEWLELAYASGARDFHALEIDPFFEKLRANSHFREITERMARDVAQMRERAREQLPETFSLPK